jgi:tetratricopeptide (TPR) repeat protein
MDLIALFEAQREARGPAGMERNMSELSFVWTKQKEMESKGRELLVAKQYIAAEIMLLKALDAGDDLITRHFIYNHLIELYYKLRDSRQDALDKCISWCRTDIDSLPAFLIAYIAQNGDMPHCPSIERLVIIYEKAGEIQKAIDLCKYAVEVGLEERWDLYNARYGTNRGYKARIEKLEKNLKRSSAARNPKPGEMRRE